MKDKNIYNQFAKNTNERLDIFVNKHTFITHNPAKCPFSSNDSPLSE